MQGEWKLLGDLAISEDLLNPTVRLMPLFGIMLSRIVPIVYLSFFLGARLLPMPVKVFISLALFAFMIPNMLIQAQNLSFGTNFITYVFKELFIGLVIGVMISVPNYVVMLAGMVIDHQRGASSLMISNLITSVQDSPLGMLFNYLLTYFYWYNDVPFTYFEVIAQSYIVLPIDTFLPVHVFSFDSSLFIQLRSVFAQIFALGIQLAAPSLVIIVMIDMFLGITNRLAPQVMISFLAQGLKAMLGLTVLYLGWYYIMTVFSQETMHWAQFVYDWIFTIGT